MEKMDYTSHDLGFWNIGYQSKNIEPQNGDFKFNNPGFSKLKSKLNSKIYP